MDETWMKTDMTRLRGSSAVVVQLFGTTPFGRRKTQTFVAELACER